MDMNFFQLLKGGSYHLNNISIPIIVEMYIDVFTLGLPGTPEVHPSLLFAI